MKIYIMLSFVIIFEITRQFMPAIMQNSQYDLGISNAYAIVYGESRSYNDYLRALARTESSNRPNAVNKYGYLGLYQMGEEALIQAGFYQPDGTNDNDWRGEWVHPAIDTKEDFLQRPELQQAAVKLYNRRNWHQIRHYYLDRFVGRTVHGVKITKSGLIAGAHLVGVGGLREFLLEGTIVTDGNGTPVTQYIQQLAGYDMPFEASSHKFAFVKIQQKPLI